jgi:hypothetical protein
MSADPPGEVPVLLMYQNALTKWSDVIGTRSRMNIPAK